MSLGSIVVALSMRTADFETDAGRAAKVAAKRAKEIDAAFTKAGKAIGVALGAGLVVAGGAFRKYVQNTIEAEKVQAQLASRITDTGAAAGRSLEQLNEQAEKLQGLTVFDDEAIGGVQAMLLTFKQIQGVQFDKAVESVLDLSTAMGTDLNSAALQLGKALNDPVAGLSALSRAGVQFSEDQKTAIKAMVEMGDKAGAQTLILRELDSQMGTAAEAARNTLGGALEGLGNAFDNLLEGDTANGGLNGTVNAVNDFSGVLNDPAIKTGIDTMAGGLLEITAAAIKAVAWLGNATAAVTDYYGATSKQSRNVLNNRRTDLESELFSIGRKSGVGYRWREDAIKKEIAEIDRALKDLAPPDPRRTFTPEYERASLNFNPHPNSPAAPPRAKGSSGGGSSPAPRRAPAMPDFLAQDQEELRRMVEETARANEEFDRMAANLSGPLAAAEYEHQQNLQQITALGLEAERSSAEITNLMGLETQRYQEQKAAIESMLGPMAEAREVLDGVQGSMVDMVASALDGSKSVGDAFEDMFDNIRRQAAAFLAEKAIQSLFEWMFGTKSAGGGGGGGWLSSLFGGGRAAGGPVSGSRLYEVGEGGSPELFQQGGRTYLIPGNDGRVIPATAGLTAPEAGEGGGATYVNVVNNSGQPAQVTERMDGMNKIVDVIVGEVDRRITRNGSTGKAIGQRFGLQPVGVARG